MLRVSLLLLLVSVCVLSVPGGYWIECQLLTQVDAQTIKAFEEWYKKENPKAQNLTLGTEYFQSRVGVFSLGEEQFFEVPIDKIISLRVVELSDVGELVERVYNRWSDGRDVDAAHTELLALFLLYEKFINPNSYWKPWLDVLPDIQDMNNILFWSAAELKELQGSPVFKRAADRRQEVKQRWEWMVPNIFRAYGRIFTTEPTEEQYKWAISIVRSRGTIIKEGFTTQPSIVPFFDMFHHTPLLSNMSKSYEYDDEESTLIVRTHQKVAANEEIFISLGEKCNSELLDFYGYVLDNNPNDCVHVDIELSKNDPLLMEKQTIYRAINPEGAKLKLLTNGITSELLQVIKLVTIDRDELTNDILLGEIPEESIGLRSELAIARYIVSTCKRHFLAYPTTLEQDKELLERDDLPLRTRLAVQMRLGEKQILRRIGSYFHEKSKQLAREFEEQFKVGDSHDEL